ncbi:MAG: tyrosine-type recombinase/integrase [Hyphomicrobiales bacterium]|nr:tyrosine-type recombinase/integrase [Hyphomicrobiales bacterium]
MPPRPTGYPDATSLGDTHTIRLCVIAAGFPSRVVFGTHLRTAHRHTATSQRAAEQRRLQPRRRRGFVLDDAGISREYNGKSGLYRDAVWFLGCGDIPRVRFHDLRHSHATQLLLAGVHPKVAQERLGHATITTTLDLYSHVTDTMQTDAATRLDAAFQTAITRAGSAK